MIAPMSKGSTQVTFGGIPLNHQPPKAQADVRPAEVLKRELLGAYWRDLKDGRRSRRRG